MSIKKETLQVNKQVTCKESETRSPAFINARKKCKVTKNFILILEFQNLSNVTTGKKKIFSKHIETQKIYIMFLGKLLEDIASKTRTQQRERIKFQEIKV